MILDLERISLIRKKLQSYTLRTGTFPGLPVHQLHIFKSVVLQIQVSEQGRA